MPATGTGKGLSSAWCARPSSWWAPEIAIVNVSLPAVQVDLGLRQSVLQWVHERRHALGRLRTEVRGPRRKRGLTNP
jgi:hypothetical protein